jgi:hypothetical protein
MSSLAQVSIITGALICLLYGGLALAPAISGTWLVAFPRSRVAGWVLTVFVISWSGWLLYHSPLGQLDSHKDLIFVLVPVITLMLGFFMDDLLAARALGGLLIIVPAMMLDAARWHDSPSRLVVTVLAYVLVVKGCVLVVAPYWFRKSVERFLSSNESRRGWGVCGALIGLALIGLGVSVY